MNESKISASMEEAVMSNKRPFESEHGSRLLAKRKEHIHSKSRNSHFDRRNSSCSSVESESSDDDMAADVERQFFS